jgi:hypothetical protein
VAKEPLIIDRFRIVAECGAEQLGHVLATLARLGITDVGYELTTDVHTFGSNQPAKRFEVSGNEFAAAWVQEQNQAFRAKDLVDHFNANGRNGASAYPTLREMLERKTVSKRDDGLYERIVLQIAAPTSKPTASPELPLGEAVQEEKKHDTTNRFEAEKFIAKRKTVTAKQLRELFKEQGRNGHSASPLLVKLKDAGLLKPVDGVPGSYEVVKQHA